MLEKLINHIFVIFMQSGTTEQLQASDRLTLSISLPDLLAC